MLKVHLKAPPEHKAHSVESSSFSCLFGHFKDATGAEIAVHKDGLWRHELRVFISIDFGSPVRVRFENPDLRQHVEIGPCPVRLVDGSMWQMGEDIKEIAHFDDRLRLWHIVSSPTVAMPGFVVMPG